MMKRIHQKKPQCNTVLNLLKAHCTKPSVYYFKSDTVTDPSESASDNEALDSEAGDSDENEDSTGQVKRSAGSKRSKQRQKAVNGKRTHVVHYCMEV